ncbi:hypothetical protein LPTSP4_25170 [Leptospira ryugenii]|mgnify:CR=1 FL=1|uniref:DUF2256 and DUF3253 domain-containing protein n=1 Tax=Leptospira ryugenii TaxID=1917863 RepID=A0A2P2E2E6_9LEPT|nr:DUF2256 and DUF3253 domain-containing protein [Leptospira ryugenii]GBF50986.1 hypothetical protein LPTSP4_25170 [Leptospira ryugenii]
MKSLPSKICTVCGRSFSYRKKWEKVWDEVLYCSDACRRSKSVEAKLNYEEAILSLLRTRSTMASICPSEVLSSEEKTDKEKMELVRRAARRLANKGQITITQKGKAIDPDSFKGPIRLKLNSLQ